MMLWKKPVVRKLAAVLIFAAAALFQVFFNNIPWPLTVEDSARLHTPSAALASQELVLAGAAPSRRGLLLSYQGNPFETVDLDFSRARLGEPTASFLAQFPPAPPPDAGEWHFVSHDEQAASGETCRAFLEIDIGEGAGASNEFHLLQLGDPGLSHMRHLEIRTDAAPLVVNMKTEWPTGNENRALGCHKRLQSGVWFRGVVNHPIQFVALPHSTVRINFVALAAGAPAWGGPDKPFQAAAFGPLLASTVTLRPIQDDGSPLRAPAALSLSAYRDSRLTVKDLEIASDSIKVGVSGRAWARAHGAIVGFDLWDALQKNVMFAAILAAANTLLLAWLRRLFFGGSAESTGPAVKSGPEAAA